MNYSKQIFIEYLSGLTTKKNDKEIWAKNADGDPITIESIDDENYIVREYWKSGKLRCECQCKNDLLHGLDRAWYENGQLFRERQYQNGVLHGVGKWWCKIIL